MKYDVFGYTRLHRRKLLRQNFTAHGFLLSFPCLVPLTLLPTMLGPFFRYLPFEVFSDSSRFTPPGVFPEIFVCVKLRSSIPFPIRLTVLFLDNSLLSLFRLRELKRKEEVVPCIRSMTLPILVIVSLP